nr:hypothetical protein [Luteibacter rhizovicinus]
MRHRAGVDAAGGGQFGGNHAAARGEQQEHVALQGRDAELALGAAADSIA